MRGVAVVVLQHKLRPCTVSRYREVSQIWSQTSHYLFFAIASRSLDFKLPAATWLFNF